MYKKFNFSLVIDGITEEDAEKILEIVTDIAIMAGADVGGGYYELDDQDEERAGEGVPNV